MNSPESLREFTRQLVRRGLPVDYARRAAEELADHHGDLVEELQATGMGESHAAAEASHRLGDTQALVKTTVREYQRRHWCARWPLLTFLIGPIPLVILAWVVTWLVCYLIVTALLTLEIIGPHEPDGIMSFGEWTFVRGVQLVFLFVLPSLVLIALARWAERAAMNIAWTYLSAGLLSLFAGLFYYDFDTKGFTIEVPRDQVVFVIGLPMFKSWTAVWHWYTQDPWLCTQALLPLGIATLFVLRNRQLALPSREHVINC